MTQIKLKGLFGLITFLIALTGQALPLYKKMPIEVAFQANQQNYRFLALVTQHQLPDTSEGYTCSLTFENTLVENDKGQLSKISSQDLVTLLKQLGWHHEEDLLQYQSSVMSEKDMDVSQLSPLNKWGQKTFIINSFRIIKKSHCQL